MRLLLRGAGGLGHQFDLLPHGLGLYFLALALRIGDSLLVAPLNVGATGCVILKLIAIGVEIGLAADDVGLTLGDQLRVRILILCVLRVRSQRGDLCVDGLLIQALTILKCAKSDLCVFDLTPCRIEIRRTSCSGSRLIFRHGVIEPLLGRNPGLAVALDPLRHRATAFFDLLPESLQLRRLRLAVRFLGGQLALQLGVATLGFLALRALGDGGLLARGLGQLGPLQLEIGNEAARRRKLRQVIRTAGDHLRHIGQVIGDVAVLPAVERDLVCAGEGVLRGF